MLGANSPVCGWRWDFSEKHLTICWKANVLADVILWVLLCQTGNVVFTIQNHKWQHLGLALWKICLILYHQCCKNFSCAVSCQVIIVNCASIITKVSMHFFMGNIFVKSHAHTQHTLTWHRHTLSSLIKNRYINFQTDPFF